MTISCTPRRCASTARYSVSGGTQAHPGGGDRAQQVGPLLLRPLQLGEERARRAERGIVGGGAVAVDRPDAEGARLAFAGDFFVPTCGASNENGATTVRSAIWPATIGAVTTTAAGGKSA